MMDLAVPTLSLGTSCPTTGLMAPGDGYNCKTEKETPVSSSVGIGQFDISPVWPRIPDLASITYSTQYSTVLCMTISIFVLQTY